MKNRRLFWPFSLSMGIIILDQLSKALVAKLIKPGTIAWKAFGDFFWLVHQQNTGAAFSMGDSLAGPMRAFVLIILPLGLMLAIVVFYFRSADLHAIQRWALAGIFGGGTGNILDRIFRPEGVVDFLSFRFYGLFGLERWPTFNVADATVVVCGLLLVIAGFFIQAPDKGTGQEA